VFVPLDGAWRVLNGQRPHVDFFTGLGPVFYLVEAAGVVLARGTAGGIADASAITSVALATWAYLVCRPRLQPGASIAFTAFIFILCFAPVALGDPDPDWHTYAMSYNRWAFALLCILLVESAVSESARLLGGVSTGAICGLLLFLKANFFLIAMGLVALSLAWNWDFRRVRGIATGFFFVTAPMLAYLRFDIAAIWNDLRTVAAARRVSLSTSHVISVVGRNWGTLVVMAGLSSAIFISEQAAMTNLIGRYRYPVLGATVFSSSILLLSTNFQSAGMPLSLAFALVCVSRICPDRKRSREFSSEAFAWLTVGASVFIAYSMYTDTASVVLAACDKLVSPRVPATAFRAEPLSGIATLGPPDTPERPVDGQWLTWYVNDGLALLRENTAPEDSVVSLDYVNPFSFALKRPPNPGGSTWLAYDDNYTDRVRPDPSRLLGKAAVVMVPKWPTSEAYRFQGTLRTYGPYLKQHFKPVAESTLWILEKRNALE